jgi:hypothetical protein
MAVTETQASLIISGRHAEGTAAAVTVALGMQPSYSHEAGDPHSSARLASKEKLRAHSNWVLNGERTARTEDDFHGMRSLDRLAEQLEPRADAIRALQADYWIVVDLFANSDSTRGGFFIGEETMRRLGLLGAAFVPTVYCDDDDT